jgi:hypothetical protein
MAGGAGAAAAGAASAPFLFFFAPPVKAENMSLSWSGKALFLVALAAPAEAPALLVAFLGPIFTNNKRHCRSSKKATETLKTGQIYKGRRCL